jgi:hypothetical protein
VGVPESLHHLLSGVRARSITLTADNLVLGGQSQFSGQVVFGLSAAGVDGLVLVLAVAEEGKDQSFIFLDFFLSLEFADEGLAALQSVHGPDESKKSILIGADGGNLSVSSETPLVSIAFFLLAAEAGGQEKSGSSQLEDAEDGDGSAEGAGGGGQEGDGQSTLVGNGGEGADTMDGSPGDGVKEKCQKSLAVHLFVS